MGGSESDPGIFINWSLRLGTTASKCITFNKFWPISRDLVFDIRILELWVVSEVLMKKRHVSKRDFYSTVVMWNRIGRHKAKDENKRADRRDYCFRHEINPLSNYNHCSQIHETDERHFEPSHASLTGENNIDDELLIAIKNRLAGVPPMPGALSLKPEAKLQPINRELPLTSNKPQYLGNIQSSKLKKVPTQVSTQVDDNMITELKNQATATSQVKVTSRYTQSGIGMALQTEETAPLRHSSRMQRADEGNRLSLPLEQNTRSYKITNGTLQTDERYQKPLQPRRNSFPNHIKQTLPSSTEVSPQANNVDSPLEHSANRNSMRSANQYSLPDPSIHSDSQSLRLPEVPEFYRMSSQRPSVTRSVRSNLDEASYNQQMNELSWTNRNNTGAILPYQQQLVHAAAHRGDGSGEVNQEHSRYQDHQPPTRREINSYKGQSQYLGNNHSSNRSLRDDCDKGSNIREESTKRPSPCRFRDDPASADHRDIQLPEEQTVLRVTTQQMERCQMCRCGSKELNLVCSCKKSALKESAVTRVYEGFRECKCPRNRNSEEDESRNKKKKKDKRGKADKEAKAEEKRRKKEEKECKKRERARQKAKEKEERKKNKCKEGKKSKNKGDKECKMCLCCKCCSDGGETTIVQSDTCLKKSKKEKKSKEKKPKGKKKGNSDECPDEPPRSCDCPQELQTDCNDGYKLPPQPTHVQISQKQVQGQQYTTDEYSYQCCNHPDVPCPALVNRELNQSRIQNSKSVLVPANSTNYCGDPVCTNTKQIKTFRSCCCCAKTSGGCEVNVCSYVANVEQPVVYRASTNMQGNSPSARVRTSPSPPRMSSFRSTGVDGDSMRYGDITAAPALILPIGVGHGDAVDVLPGMPTTDTRSTSLPTGCSSLGNVLIDSSRKGRENGTNKRYVPPCVLYLDCTKVKDLCVIIKDKYEEPS